MPRITQYTPSFIDMGSKPKEEAFSTTEGLLNIPFVRHFAIDKTFSGYAMDDESLMATYKEGKEWYVIGSIDKTSGLDLPKWRAGEPGKMGKKGHPYRG